MDQDLLACPDPEMVPEEWRRTPPSVRQCLLRWLQRVHAVAPQMAQRPAEHAQLRAQVGRHSQTSSHPPSADPPQALGKRPRREPRGRRPGGQPGHEGQSRALRPVEAVDVVRPVKPERCPRCQQPLGGEEPQPERHQVTESPPVTPVVTEDPLHRLVGPACGAATRADLPPGDCGPRVQAMAARCTGAYHLSKRTRQSVLEEVFGVAMRLGTRVPLEPATVQAVAAPVAEARGYVQAQAVAHLDETGWREGRARAWLWTAVTAWVTVVVVRTSRSATVAQARVGERFWGILVTDRGSADTWYPPWWRQVCWAHLRRDIAAMRERGGRSAERGEALRTQARQRCHGWHRVRDGTRTHASVRVSMGPVRREGERRLEAGHTCGVPKTEGMCRKILQRREARWTFVRVEGVEPTNNAAERAMRPGVRWRKGSFGTQRAEGSRVVEAMMTVVATRRQQHRHVLTYLTAACEAALCGEPAPSLLPTPADIEQLMHPAA